MHRPFSLLFVLLIHNFEKIANFVFGFSIHIPLRVTAILLLKPKLKTNFFNNS